MVFNTFCCLLPLPGSSTGERCKRSRRVVGGEVLRRRVVAGFYVENMPDGVSKGFQLWQLAIVVVLTSIPLV
jgi:hypothetical protein